MGLNLKNLAVACTISALFLCGPGIASEKREAPFIVFVLHGDDQDYWSRMVRTFTTTVAKSLDIRFEIDLSADGREAHIRQAQAYLDADDKPDYILFQNFQSTAPEMIAAATNAGVHSLVLLNGLTEEDAQKVGPPQTKTNPFWLGEFLPNDEDAGYRLAAHLLDKARDRNDGRIDVIALDAGSFYEASRLRSAGLARALTERPSVNLIQEVSARWSHDVARVKSGLLLRRHPSTSVIWAANDNMALGALDQAKKRQNDILIGGIDWLPQMFKAIEENDISISLGGQFMDGGWALTLLYDHFHGKDSAEILTRRKFISTLSIMTPNNVGDLKHCISEAFWSTVDFRQFTQTHNPNWHAEMFGPDLICSGLMEQGVPKNKSPDGDGH